MDNRSLGLGIIMFKQFLESLGCQRTALGAGITDEMG